MVNGVGGFSWNRSQASSKGACDRSPRGSVAMSAFPIGARCRALRCLGRADADSHVSMVVHARPVCTHDDGRIRSMRMSAKAEYAVRAMVQLASADEGSVVKTDDLAKAQGIPPQFLVDILSDLRTDRLVRSRRGRDGGYELAMPAAEISIADVLRCIDGPLASVRDIGLGDLPYSGPTASLTDVWRALRASMRSVLEETSLADVAAGALPTHVQTMADDYRDQEEERGHTVD